MARLFTGLFAPDLEDRFAEELASAKEDDPFRPLSVVVPTRALVRRLQSVLAARASWINVSFFTFFTLAVSLLKASHREVRPTPPTAVLLLLLKEVIESRDRQNEHTAYFLSYKNSLARLLALFSRFTSYRVTPPARPSGIERTIFEVYEAYRVRKHDRGILDADDLIDEAARLLDSGVSAGPPLTAFLYGFYDLNPLQREIVRLLDARGDLAVFSPGGFSPAAEEFFRETASFYRELARGGEGPGRADRGHERVIGSIAQDLFSAPGPPRREAGGLVDLVTASGPRGEARAVAMEIIRVRREDPSLRWSDISVVMRDRVEFGRILADAFSDYSIPAVFEGGQPLSSMPEVAYFLVLLTALERGLPRDDVTFLVSSALFSWPGLPDADADWVRENAYLLAAFGKEYRVISGSGDWDNAFKKHESLTRDADPFPEGVEAPPPSDRSRLIGRYVRAVQPVVNGFLSALTDIPAEAPLLEYRDRLTSLVDTYIRPSRVDCPALGYLKEVLSTLTAVSPIRHSARREDCVALLRDMISEKRGDSPEDIDGVFVSDVMGARGLPRRVVLLTGMNEKVFPRMPIRDPFLSDETGRALGLPTAASRSLEDHTLFALTVGSARDRLIVTRQRSDDAGRTLAPSPFLTELVSRITIDGNTPSLSAQPSRPSGRDYPRITATDAELSAYRAQDLRARLCLGWPDDHDAPAVRGAVSDTPFLGDGIRALDERASDRPFSRYDGLIGGADGIMDMALPLSSQRLETYASCPFDFFMRYILSAPEEEDVQEELDVEALELGLIYHRILSRLIPSLVRDGLLTAEMADPDVVDGLVAGHIKRDMSGRLLGRIPALILRAREEHAARIVGRLIDRERRAAASGFVPAHYEVTFGSGRSGPSEYPALEMVVGPRTVECVGRIDRIDFNEADASFAVIDYKRRKGTGKRRLRTDILAGRHFQLPIYLMAADALIAGGKYRPGAGALVYLEADDDAGYRETLPGQDYTETRDIVMERIGAILDEMASGRFTPSRGDSCRFCSYRDVCRSDIKAISAARSQKGTGEGDGEGDGGDDEA